MLIKLDERPRLSWIRLFCFIRKLNSLYFSLCLCAQPCKIAYLPKQKMQNCDCDCNAHHTAPSLSKRGWLDNALTLLFCRNWFKDDMEKKKKKKKIGRRERCTSLCLSVYVSVHVGIAGGVAWSAESQSVHGLDFESMNGFFPAISLSLSHGVGPETWEMGDFEWISWSDWSYGVWLDGLFS